MEAAETRLVGGKDSATPKGAGLRSVARSVRASTRAGGTAPVAHAGAVYRRLPPTSVPKGSQRSAVLSPDPLVAPMGSRGRGGGAS